MRQGPLRDRSRPRTSGATRSPRSLSSSRTRGSSIWKRRSRRPTRRGRTKAFTTSAAIAARVGALKRHRDIAIASIHWGGNWGYDVPHSQRAFARELVEQAGIDVVHGHSSHDAKGIEIHRDRPILYGCGDLLNDYEGIGGYKSYRGELALMYFPTFGASGALEAFTLVPTTTRHFRVNRARNDDVAWLAAMLAREGRKFRTSAVREAGNTLVLRW